MTTRRCKNVNLIHSGHTLSYTSTDLSCNHGQKSWDKIALLALSRTRHVENYYFQL